MSSLTSSSSSKILPIRVVSPTRRSVAHFCGMWTQDSAAEQPWAFIPEYEALDYTKFKTTIFEEYPGAEGGFL